MRKWPKNQRKRKIRKMRKLRLNKSEWPVLNEQFQNSDNLEFKNPDSLKTKIQPFWKWVKVTRVKYKFKSLMLPNQSKTFKQHIHEANKWVYPLSAWILPHDLMWCVCFGGFLEALKIYFMLWDTSVVNLEILKTRDSKKICSEWNWIFFVTDDCTNGDISAQVPDT